MNQNSIQRNSSIAYISVMNVLAAVSVVILHANVSFWLDKSKPLYWPTANVIESVFYFAVPVFFMLSVCNADRLSGQIFDKRNSSVKNDLKKRDPFLGMEE